MAKGILIIIFTVATVILAISSIMALKLLKAAVYPSPETELTAMLLSNSIQNIAEARYWLKKTKFNILLFTEQLKIIELRQKIKNVETELDELERSVVRIKKQGAFVDAQTHIVSTKALEINARELYDDSRNAIQL